MKYRAFGSLNWKPSALGFGAMRLPIIGNDPSKIDEPLATRMIHYAIDHGVNYVDTAYTYHGETCEPFLGRALQDGYRDQVKLATKMPCWLVEESNDFDRFLDEQLERLQTDHIEFYLLHALRGATWTKMDELGVLTWAEKALADGRIGYLGFSFHDKLEDFIKIVDATDLWTLCQIQYNFMDIEYQAGTKGLEYAASKGLAVVVMEPLRGGRLTKSIPPSIQEIWQQAPRDLSPADYALQWVWNHPEVSLVLSGMTAMEHVVENIASAEQSGLATLSTDELALIDKVRKQYEELCPVPCTDCMYCLPCPSGVNIPRVLEMYNDLVIYGDEDRAKMAYQRLLSEEERANLCVECGECLEKCPQQIEIPDWLSKAHAALC